MPMRNKIKVNYGTVVLGIGAIAMMALWYSQLTPNGNSGSLADSTNTNVVTPAAQTPQTPAAEETGVRPRQINLPVPFISQSPFGEWEDPRQQDACEEASILMAKWWINGTTGSLQQAKDELLALSAIAEQMLGTYHDSSAADTLRIFKQSMPAVKAEVFYSVSAEDIKKHLAEGKVVLAPANGQKLGNPNFTGAGPERHMFLIRGFDEARKQFITNDPGTRKGENYRYTYD